MTDDENPIDIRYTPKPRRPPTIMLAKKGGGVVGSYVKGLFISTSTFIEKKLVDGTVKETPKHRYVFSVLESSEKTALIFSKKGEKPIETPVVPHGEYTVTGRADLDRQMEDVRANPRKFVGVPFHIVYEDFAPNSHGGNSHIFSVGWDDRYVGKLSPSVPAAAGGEEEEA